jgi:hypothetical protein
MVDMMIIATIQRRMPRNRRQVKVTNTTRGLVAAGESKNQGERVEKQQKVE